MDYIGARSCQLYACSNHLLTSPCIFLFTHITALLHCSDQPLKDLLLTRDVMAILDQRTADDVVAFLTQVEEDRLAAELKKREVREYE